MSARTTQRPAGPGSAHILPMQGHHRHRASRNWQIYVDRCDPGFGKGFPQRMRVHGSAGALSACFGGGPHGLVVDNASQSMEANVAYPILRAYSMGELRRVLIIGDHHQHPALSAERNPFSATGSVSLIERQIRAGTSHIRLQTQYM